MIAGGGIASRSPCVTKPPNPRRESQAPSVAKGIGPHPEDVMHMKRTADGLFGDQYRSDFYAGCLVMRRSIRRSGTSHISATITKNTMPAHAANAHAVTMPPT